MTALAAALQHHQAGRAEEAEALYAEALADDPRDPTALYLYGLFHFQEGRAGQAADLLQAVVDLRPDHVEAQVTLANVLHWRGDLAGAIGAYGTARRLAPDHVGALVGLANALRDSGEADLALEAATDAVQRHPEQLDTHMALASARLAAGDVGGAADAYRAAIALNPAAAQPRANLSLALMQAGRAEAALAEADGALECDPTLAEAWFARGAALLALHRPAEAAMALDCSAVVDPSRAATHLSLGNAYAELDQAEQAADHLKRALILDPASKEAHASLASVYLLAGRDAAAERHARSALEIDPQMVVAHQNLASILAGRGLEAESKRHRDLAYAGRSLIIDRAAAPRCAVLVIVTSGAGNVPLRLLLPKRRFDRLRWVIEYGRQDEALPPYDVVFNAVGDPDLAGPTAAPLARFMATCSRPLLNDPAKVAATRRDLMSDRLAGIAGVITPKAQRLSGDALKAMQLDFPVLIRPVGAHGGQGLVLAREAGDLAEVEARGDYYVTDYHDARNADGCWRKYRMIFVDRQPYPYHLAVSDRWLVHYESAAMDKHPLRRAEEQRFLENPRAVLGAAGMAAIAEIGRRLDLDYCGVDFTVTDDGQILVFEANATMLVHDEQGDGPFAYKNSAVCAITAAFDALIDRAASA